MINETSRLRLCVYWTCVLAVLLTGAPLAGQDEQAKPAVAPAVAPADAPAAKPPADQGPAAKSAATPADEEGKKEVPPPETDPIVLAVLEVKPTTPEQWLQDIRALIQLNRPALAKEYLTQFAAALPPANELARLQARFGSDFFLELSTQPALQPEGATVANAALQAADARRRDAQRLAGLIDRLAGQDAPARRLAMADLVQTGPVAIPALVAALADPARAAAHPVIIQALAAIGPGAVAPLTAALQSTDKNVQVAVLGALAQLKSRETVPYLLLPALREDGDAAVREAAAQALQAILQSVPSRREAVYFLNRRIDQFLANAPPAAVDEQGLSTLWVWDAAQQMPIERPWTAADAAFLTAAELAHQRYLIDPDRQEHRIVYLVTALELAKRQEGYDRALSPDTPLVQEAAQAGTEVLEQVLASALKRKLYGAAIAVLELLGDTRDASLVASSDGQPRLLVRALSDPHRRVQFAAARAIMKCAPQSAYPGSSHLAAVLGHLAASAGRPRVLIGDPRNAVAQSLAGFFDELGYDADTAPTGRAFVLQAVDSPDYVFLLIGDAIDQPPFAELVQVLRRDARTADLPIGIMAHEVNAEAARRVAELDPLTLVLPPLRTREDVAADIERLVQAAGRQLVPADERLREASFAIDALTTLADDTAKYGFYDVLRLEPRVTQALRTPTLTARAGHVLGLLGSPTAQKTLIEMASDPQVPLADRQAAAAALRVAVNRRGLLLTRARLQEQYDLYNASEHLDGETQKVLASILDTLEAPTRKAESSPAEK